LSDVLEGLSWLHVARWLDPDPPPLGSGTALLTHVADLRGAPHDTCDENCPDKNGPSHHHFLINVARGFLGALEQLGSERNPGVRTYDFSLGGQRKKGPTLRSIGKTGHLSSFYLPAVLGRPHYARALTDRHIWLLQSLVRETMRVNKHKGARISETAVFDGRLVRDFHGTGKIPCPLLNASAKHVAFAGNGVLKGQGYLLMSPGGWLAKAGYDRAAVGQFLNDLADLAARLRLTVAGLYRSEWFDLDQMRAMAQSSTGRQELEKLHLRVYTDHDYLDRWDRFFAWNSGSTPIQVALQNPAVDLSASLAARRMSRRCLAVGIGVDPSFLNKLFKGDKPWPNGLAEKAQAWLSRQSPSDSSSGPAAVSCKKDESDVCMESVALSCLQRGWAVVPQEAGAKKPCVRWKEYQQTLPSVEICQKWWRQWPDAGIAMILGRVSGVFVIDVDGPEAHAALIARLGAEPMTCKAISGSGKPCRYHLFFKCPNLATKAKQTPWHEQLEFRGDRGIIILPPSCHKSGGRYAWADGRSPDECPLADVPPQVLQALMPVARPLPRNMPALSSKTFAGITASPRTLAFLAGRWADGPGWNQKLFSAACDLNARNVALDRAEPLLLAGAQPYNLGEEELARRTIRSAYSQQREPARC
jgi:hypothetical protein